MHILSTLEALEAWRSTQAENGHAVGFVPTMGALHAGHLSLIQEAKKMGHQTVVSIYVNPTQFNQAEDLAKYPRTPEKDAQLLQNAGVDALFLPTDEMIYPDGARSNAYDLGTLETTMEGLHRPGHFQGVATVVDRLFELVRPDHAYFGEKDFQQVAVIRKMVALTRRKVHIHALPTLRETNGLAMSSRNERLSKETRLAAGIVYDTLQWAAANTQMDIADLLCAAQEKIESDPRFEVEYLGVADEKTLREENNWKNMNAPRLFCAVWAEGVRLIDNTPLY